MKSKGRVPTEYQEGTRDWEDQYNMLLDDGVTCKECAHVERCCAIFGQRPYVNSGRCQFYPNRFTPLSHVMAAYVLIGWSGDTFDYAEKRLIQTAQAGFVPYAMLYRDEKGTVNEDWRKFQREWCRPQIVCGKFNQIWNAALTEKGE